MNSDFNVAVHALVYLSYKDCTMSSEVLAQNICTNPARVRKVMGKLSKAGFIHTKEGLEGGYHLAVPSDRITLEEVSRALDIRFVSTNWKSGDPDKTCLICSGMGSVMDELYGRLDQVCKSWLTGVTVSNIENRIFGDKPASGCGAEQPPKAI